VPLLAKPYRKSDTAIMIRKALGDWAFFCFDAFSSREPVSTPLENAMGQTIRRQACREVVITIRTRSAAFRAPSFFMILAR
jgi:hypothetical protein